MDLSSLSSITHPHGSICRADFVGRVASRHVWYGLIRRGVLIETLPTIARIGEQPAAPLHRAEAAALAVGPSALIAGPVAAAVWLDDPISDSYPVDIISRRRTRHAPITGVTVHRPVFGADLGTSNRHHLRLTSPLRALIDTAAWRPDVLDHTIERLVLDGLVSPRSLDALAARHSRQGHPGIGRLRTALADWSLDRRPPESTLEVRAMRLLRRHLLPPAIFQYSVGRYRVDAAWPRWRAAMECDGYEFHGLRDRFERDRERDAALASAGWVVWRFTWRQIVQRQEWVAEQLGAALARRQIDLGSTPAASGRPVPRSRPRIVRPPAA